ncbi:YcaO-like family protein [Halococcoides cellulosivorans]|uniref:Bacteriocin biosynthesis protein SagD n=1 Tax=Halococcoides cellulosivorans TaxID=1679096 RepID=A0A2R4X1E9_9EURY|nr:YcaO-like family protein [Halococcoides cellulosivorans]AWB27620.1 bacteriocin biosynthesis protein SagD [Halococcoides cellulosivorans]
MDVAILSTGPAASAARSALAETDFDVEQTASVADADCVIAIAASGSEAFHDVDRRCREHAIPWLAVELGGIAGHGVVEFAITAFDGSPCYACLCDRVAATTDEATVDDVTEPIAHLAGASAARQAYDLLTGAGDPIDRVLESPHAERRLLPVPGCDCREGTVPPTSDDSMAPLQRAEIGRDDRVGIVTSAGELETEPLPYYLAELADPSGFLDRTPRLQAAGVAPDWQDASMAALGEAYERYAAATVTPEDRRAVPDERVDPAAFVAPSDPDAGWLSGRRLSDDARVAVPADRVVYPAPADSRGTTTGLALGDDRPDAIRRGLLEVIERDAAMLFWYSSADPLGLDIDDERFDRLVGRVTSDCRVTTLLVTQDVDVPVVAVALHREKWPAFSIATAAALDPVAAAQDALREAVQNWMELRRIGRSEAAGGHVPYADRPPAVEDLLDPDRSVPAAGLGVDTDAPVESLVDRLADVDLDAYAVDLTPPDVATMGLAAARAIVPGAQPWAESDVPFGERAREVPVSMGFEPRLDRDRHPFP